MDDVEEQKCTPVRASKHADEAQKRVSIENSDNNADVGVKKKRVSREKESSTNDTIEKSGGKDDFEKQKCKKIRTPKKIEKGGRKRSKEKEDIPPNRQGSKDNFELNERKRSSSEHQLDEGPPSQQTSNAEISADDQQKIRPKAKSKSREKEAPTQEVDENIYAAGRVGIASEDQPVEVQTSATTTTGLETKSETKTDSKTDKDNSPTDTIASETPSKQAEKPKKKKKAQKEVKEVKDENNAVGQIIADDEISFDEKKKKKSENKKPNKKENTARRSKKPKNESIDEAEKPTKLKKVRSLDGSSRGHKALKSQDGSARAPKKAKKLAKQESRDTLPTKSPSFDTLMELFQRDSNVKKKWKPRSNTQNEQSKRNDFSTVKKTRKDKQDGFFKTMFNKAKTTITAKLNKSDDTFVANPEFHMKMNDVRAEYGSPEDFGPPPEKPVESNFDNNGKLFLNGYPFWCIKDEKPPSSKNYVMTNAMRDLTEGKWSLLPEALEPKDLDAYHTVDHMVGRDAELFKKNKRILSNTIRSLATLHESRIKKKKENSESSGEHLGDGGRTPKERIMSFVIPKLLIQYNRKNRHEPTHSINFTPGIMKKVRNSQRRRGAPTLPPPTPAQLP